MGAKIENNLQSAKKNGDKLLKRNKLKWFGFHLAGMLYYSNSESELRKSYQNTFYCCNFIEVTQEGMAKAKYCKNRWCPICQRNKMGLMINQYGPRLQKCEELWFLTLTRQNVSADKLRKEVVKYQTLWRAISKTSQYRKAMKKGVIGIRKVECTYHGTEFLKDGTPDPWFNTYHPHFHLLLTDKELAEFVVQKWLELNPDSSEDAQDIRKVETAGGYLEIFKYFTKLIAKDNKGKRFFDAVHMDVVFRGMRGLRAYIRLGTLKAWGCAEVTEEDEAQAAVIETDASPAFYQWQEFENFFGWYDVNTGETLTELPKVGNLFEIITESEKKYGKETEEP